MPSERSIRAEQLSLPTAVAVPLIVFALATLVAIAVLALLYDLQLYADGAFFCFGLGTDDPWSHTWANYPLRLSVYALVIVPAHWLAEASGQLGPAIKLYGLAWGLAPVASILATGWIAGWRSLVTAVAAFSIVSFGLLTVYFPTEVAMTQALFWPLLAYALAPGTRNAAVLIWWFAAFVFTHELAVPLAPLLGLIALSGKRDRGDRLKVLAAVGLALAAWLWVRSAMPPPNLHVREALRVNAAHLLDWTKYQNRVVAWMLGGWALCLACWAAGARRLSGAALPIAILMAVAGTIAALLLCDPPVYAAQRYPARTYVFLWLLAVSIGGCLTRIAHSGSAQRLLSPGPIRLVLRAERAIAAKPGRVGRMLLALTMVAGALHMAEALRFTRAWLNYGRELEAIGSTAPLGVGTIAGPLPSPAQPVGWDWATPFHSLILARANGRASLVHATRDESSPLTCDDVRALAGKPGVYDRRSLLLLERYVCGLQRAR